MPLSLLPSCQKNTYSPPHPKAIAPITVEVLPSSSILFNCCLIDAPPQRAQISLTVIGASDGLMIPEGIRADLLRLCDEEEITPETFIEAAIALLQSKPELKEAVVDTCWTQTSSLLCLQMRQPSWLVKKNDYKRLNDRQSNNSGRVA